MQTIADDFMLPRTNTANNAEFPPSTDKRARIEEVEDEETHPETSGLRFAEPYPHPIAQPIRCEKTRFEVQQDQDSTAGRHPWEPFTSKEEWELATWLINNVNQTATDTYLKLPIVRPYLISRLENVRLTLISDLGPEKQQSII